MQTSPSYRPSNQHTWFGGCQFRRITDQLVDLSLSRRYKRGETVFVACSSYNLKGHNPFLICWLRSDNVKGDLADLSLSHVKQFDVEQSPLTNTYFWFVPEGFPWMALCSFTLPGWNASSCCRRLPLSSLQRFFRWVSDSFYVLHAQGTKFLNCVW